MVKKDSLLPIGMGILIGLVMSGILAGASSYGSPPRWPESTGETVYQDGKLTVDASHIGEGYFVASVPGGSKHRLKLRVTKDEFTLTYDLNGEGQAEVFPLQLGSGDYEIGLYENIAAKKYAQEGHMILTAALSSEDIAFLYPNQYVNYTSDSPIVEKAVELCASCTEKEAYEAVCDFMRSEFVYDFVRAVTVNAGSLPDIEGCYETRMGICQDLSALMVGILRTQGIPARLMIGYADNNYHAWTSAEVDGEERFFDPTAELNAIAKPEEYSLERFY